MTSWRSGEEATDHLEGLHRACGGACGLAESVLSPLHLPSPEVGEYEARGLGSVLFVSVFHLERVGETQPCILGPACGYIQFAISLRG